MKSIVLSLLLLAVPYSQNYGVLNSRMSHPSYVWICTGSKAYAYHSNRNCSGLNRCGKCIVKVTLAEAKERGYRPCKRCY